jgi:tRNA A-37 threonylcarbamoyl transferase component Bud32
MSLDVFIHPNYNQLHAAISILLVDFENKGEYLTKGARNVIKKATVDGVTLTIKKFKTPSFVQGIVYQYLRKSKAKRSFEYARQLIDAGIKTPFPIAYAEHFSGGLKESYYVSEFVDYDLDFRVLNHNPLYPNRDEILTQFAAFTFQLHENDINFLDHSPGNTLIKILENNTYDFYLIDLNRMKFQPLSLEKRMHNMRRMWLSKKMIEVMAAEYARLYGTNVSLVQTLMQRYSKEFQGKVNRKKLRRRRGRY